MQVNRRDAQVCGVAKFTNHCQAGRSNVFNEGAAKLNSHTQKKQAEPTYQISKQEEVSMKVPLGNNFASNVEHVTSKPTSHKWRA
jgi:hypothetical protein